MDGLRFRAEWMIVGALCALCTAGCSSPKRGGNHRAASPKVLYASPTYGKSYASRWYDGHAEVATYRLSYPRYGSVRKGGRAVAIFVTENFNRSKRVKSDNGGPGTLPVFKLNFVQDFQTGIYDYNLMTSVFVATKKAYGLPRGAAVKVSYSAQEWCGHVYGQALLGADAIETQLHSYFESEADKEEHLASSASTFAEDALLLWARGLAGPRLAKGESVTIPLLRSLEVARMQHLPLAVDRAELSRMSKLGATRLGDKEVAYEERVAKVSRKGGSGRLTYRFWVETSAPRRLLRISRSDGYLAEFVASKRIKYWELNKLGDERYLEEIRLEQLKPVTDENAEQQAGEVRQEQPGSEGPG